MFQHIDVGLSSEFIFFLLTHEQTCSPAPQYWGSEAGKSWFFQAMTREERRSVHLWGPVGFSLTLSLFYELPAGGRCLCCATVVDATADAQFAAEIVDQYLRLERLLE